MLPEYDHETEIRYIYVPDDEDDLITDEGWTWKRIIYLLIALVMIAAMITMYVLLPIIQSTAPSSPPATPIPLPGSLV